MRLERTNMEHILWWMSIIFYTLATFCYWIDGPIGMIAFHIGAACYLGIESRPTRIMENGR